MKYTCEILRVSDGVVRSFEDDGPEEYATLRFLYEEGNYSCDCNRAIFFSSRCSEEGESEEVPCSEGLFKVNLKIDGKMFYREF